MKKIVSFVLVMIMLISSPGQSLAHNSNIDSDNRLDKESDDIYVPGQMEETYQTGLLQDEMIEIERSDIDLSSRVDSIFETVSPLSAEYKSVWDAGSTYYFYNLSTDEEKELLWEKLDEACRYYLTSPSLDARYMTQESGKTVCHTGFVEIEGWTVEEIHEFVQIFRANNPQYYYLNNMFLYATEGETVTFALGIYEAFRWGHVRVLATEEFQTQIEEWKKELADCESEEEMLYEIHRLICEKVDYNEAIYGEYDEEVEFTQSAYSVMCMDRTVCAGYAEAVALMCNLVGIDAISVTSYNHQWNKVRLGDQWYNVDATWADQSYGIDYEFYLRNDDYYDNAAAQAESHEEETFWEEYLPVCNLDSNPTMNGYYYDVPGTLPSITETVEAPTYSVVETDGGYLVEFINITPGATIYYTMDGRIPSVAFSKSEIYNGTPFFLKEDATLRAISVMPGYCDSDVTTRNGSIENKGVGRLMAENHVDGVYLTWDRLYEAEGYNIYKGTAGPGLGKYEWEKIATITDNMTNSYLYTDIQSGEEYYYCVRGYLGDSESRQSIEDIGFYDVPYVYSVVQDEYTLTVTWNAVEGAEKYLLYMKLGKGTGWYSWLILEDTTELSYTFTLFEGDNVKPGDVIEFLVQAEGSGGYSEWYEENTMKYVFQSWDGLIINPFTDVAKGAYYYEPVLWAVENNITAGLTETTFGPEETCTRAQIVTFLWRNAGCPVATSTTNPFVDVPADAYYTDAVLWAVENGITAGLTEKTFGPEETCTRAQIVTFLWRAFGEQEPTTSTKPFKDVPADAYYTKAVLWAVENGITAGLTETTFGPEAACTRGQVVSFLYRAYEE